MTLWEYVETPLAFRLRLPLRPGGLRRRLELGAVSLSFSRGPVWRTRGCAVCALAEVGPCPRADAGVEVQVFVIHLDGIAGDGLLPSVAPGFRPSPV